MEKETIKALFDGDNQESINYAVSLAMQSKAKTSLERADQFSKEIKKVIELLK